MKAIVTTTINPPTKALKEFLKIAKEDDWHLIVVGDKKTPHDKYNEWLNRKVYATYYHPDEQESDHPALSKAIGWNCIQRRNLGLLLAYNMGADIIATIDDDNIPYKGWGRNCVVNKAAELEIWETKQPAFDPLSTCGDGHGYSIPIWHRGFPIQLLPDRAAKLIGAQSRNILVQADLWNGDPDVDAICRIGYRPDFGGLEAHPMYSSDTVMPFNSQNTFLSRELFPTYFLFPHVGRMDDIWAAFVTQFEFPKSVAFGPASVYQERNEHDLVKDLKAEMLGYEHNLEFVQSPKDWKKFLPPQALVAYQRWQECFDK